MGVRDLEALGLAVHLPRRRRPEPVDRVRLLEAERERVDPGGADQLHPAAALEIDGAAMRLAPRHPEIPEDGERDGPIHHVARQEAEEAAGARRLGPDHRVQGRPKCLPSRRPGEDRRRCTHGAPPAGRSPASSDGTGGVQTLAGWHHSGLEAMMPPGALREADAHERPVDLGGEAREVGLDGARRPPAAGPRTRARCPGRSGASARAGLAAEGEPAERDGGRADGRVPARRRAPAPAGGSGRSGSATIRPTSYGVPPSDTSRLTSAVTARRARARSSTDAASLTSRADRHRVRRLKPQEVVARHDADQPPGLHDAR